ncbi:MAG: YihY family inner membrane protein [Hydrogenophilus sp.]|nr:YihY family inner membrane protein [Hydrogenophilus sp.]
MKSLQSFGRAFLRRFLDRFIATNCWEVAGGLAFTTLIAVVPVATLTLLFFRSFPALTQLGEALRDFLAANLLPEAAAQIITRYTEEFTAKATQLTVLGSAILLFTAILLLATIEDVFNRIWNARRARGWTHRLTLYWFVLTAGPILVGGSIATARSVAEQASEIVGHTTWVDQTAAALVPLSLLWLFFFFLYYAVPHHPVRSRVAALAGLLVALLFLLLQRIFGWFVTTMPTYTFIYGAFAVLPIFLLWLYALWLLILSGAVAAAAFEETLAEIRSLPDFPGRDAFAALTLLEALWNGQRRATPLPQEMLWHAARLAPHECERILEALESRGWVERGEEGHWIAVVTPDSLTLGDLLAAFALDWNAWREHATTPLTRRLPTLFIPILPALTVPLQEEWVRAQTPPSLSLLSSAPPSPSSPPQTSPS